MIRKNGKAIVKRMVVPIDGVNLVYKHANTGASWMTGSCVWVVYAHVSGPMELCARMMRVMAALTAEDISAATMVAHTLYMQPWIDVSLCLLLPDANCRFDTA